MFESRLIFEKKFPATRLFFVSCYIRSFRIWKFTFNEKFDFFYEKALKLLHEHQPQIVSDTVSVAFNETAEHAGVFIVAVSVCA